MRIVMSLLFSFVALVLSAGAVFLIVREGLLMWSMQELRQSAAQMRKLAVNIGPYGVECRKKGVLEDENVVTAIQLRFLNDTEYVIEIVCGQFKLDPILVATKKLPFMVKKVPGSAGIIWGGAPSGVRVELWGRTRAMLQENKQLFYTSNPKEELGITPLSSCGGYGYSCCAEESAQGLGDQLEQALDCPRTCYASCQRRPVVLSLSTDPFYDPETRTLGALPGDVITFVYVIDSPAGGSVVLDYGDGTKETVTTMSGTTTHQYQCATAVCTYKMKLKVTDTAGVTSVDTPVSQVTVRVGR